MIPYINPNVRYVGAAKLRQMNQSSLEKLVHPVVVKKSDGTELAVILPWATFLELQRLAAPAPEEPSR